MLVGMEPIRNAPGGSLISTLPRRTVLTAEAGMVLALATVLKAVTLWQMPAGGSVTAASVAPLWIFARRHGAPVGTVVGGCFGVLNLMMKAHIVHWVQPFMDYVLAFMTAGVAGVRRVPLWLAVVLSALIRYGIHVASGIIFFASSTPAGSSVLEFSLVYNLYVLPDSILAIAVLFGLSRRVPGLVEPQI